MLMNFDTEIDLAGGAPLVKVIDKVEMVERTTVTVRPSESRTHLSVPDSEWGWMELRDYVVSEIEARTGAFPRDARKEAGIFKGFVSRWGAQAPAIARHAFGVCDGMWRGAPIAVTRFCLNSDPYFAQVIAERLA